jgi:glutamate synthase domain-containing protein 3
MNAIDAKEMDIRQLNSLLRESVNGSRVAVKNASHIHGLGGGLKHGEVLVQSHAGDYLAVLNDGASIKVFQDVGNYVADNMTRGEVIIKGDAGYGAAQYCYGGSVVIYGNAGDFTATMNKGATIIVAGNVGDEVGTYMLNGDLIVIGNAGKNFANYLIRGSVYIAGEWESLGHNTEVVALDNKDGDKLRSLFEAYEIAADPAVFKKVVAASPKPFYK